MNKIIKTNIIICFCSLLLIACNTQKTETVAEVAELQEIFESAKQKEKTDYDLEETIRIIHGLDIAKKESKNFTEFFEFMAKQDYSKVASDVIEAKSKLLPILNELRLAERELKNAQALWNTFSGLSEVVVGGVSSGINSFVSGNYSIMTKNIVDTGKQSFTTIKEQKTLEKEIKKKIAGIQKDYIGYLEFFTPIYFKYMGEWDKICINRDNAYLHLHNGNIDEMLVSIGEVLKIDPKNRESNILKAFGLLMKAHSESQKPSLINEEISVDTKKYIEEAKEILDEYISNNPKRSAPALLLMGTYYTMIGDNNRAITMYNQSAVEYPRQSEELLDMLNSYRQRSYLRKSAEGMYINQLYKAIMEGYGFFSPNFQKALIAKNNNDLEAAKEEILKHFFRRGNQDIYDYLIADMIHCEKYFPESFNMIFKEKSFLDLEATTGLFGSKNLNLKINNRSDLRLSNVRIFLCLHFTDMYKDDYEVIKVNTTVNHINPHTIVDLGKVEIDFEIYGKKKTAENDIVTARAIIVTDDIIAWVDKEEFKITKIKQSYDNYNNNIDSKIEFDKFYSLYGLKGEKILQNLEKEFVVETKITMVGKDEIKIKLPRSLALLNPYFSINEINTKEAIFPSTVNLNGSFIEIMFNHKIPKDSKIDFYLTSEKAKIKWEIYFEKEGKIKNYLVGLE